MQRKKKMMNIIGLCLVVTSLVAAGVWSPEQTTSSNNDDNTIVKEGHRVVVVEYDKEDQRLTKVSISPDTPQQPTAASEEHWRNPKELICDAYGKCKHKIADAVGKAKDTVHGAEHAVKETVRDVEETAERVREKVKEKFRDGAHGAEHAVKETVHDVEETAERVREKMKEKAERVEEGAMGAMKGTRDLGKTIGVDVAQNVTGFMARVRSEAVWRVGLLAALVSPDALNPVSGTIYMLSFCTAYGAGVWVTFALSHVLSRALPRQQLALVLSKVYQAYFRTMAVCLSTAAFWFVMIHRGKVLGTLLGSIQLYVLVGSLLLVLINALVFEPKATKVMLEKMKLEKEEGRGREEVGAEGGQPPPEPETTEASALRNRGEQLNGRLKKLNKISAFLNILTLMALSFHVCHLGRRLYLSV